jgi:voltage-gated potassium channel
MATVGFGDLVPKTDLGRAIASVMMLLGWGVLAVPTGIVTAEMARRGPDDERRIAVAPRGILGMTPPAPAVPAKRVTPAARRRALAQHRRGER